MYELELYLNRIETNKKVLLKYLVAKEYTDIGVVMGSSLA